ncbi:MAG TPA: glycosyltransferase family 2 protein [Methylomirabilota bacterium]|nr:glycosyltransferase family 2 protein [Methylomirabilota bacterium]
MLTPVYNGEAYLARCIESTLAQTYPHWEYVIVDNASSDATLDIARRYAAHDHRLRVYTNRRTVPVVENFNIAARHVSPESRWCKYVCADDILFPECLERMVELAGQHPTVGLVSAYHLQGPTLTLGGLPYPSPVLPGREVGRASLLGFLHAFGSPTAHMIRADFVRAREAFYDEANLHADEAACYEVLTASDFGFVHQVLTYAEVHRSSVTFSVARQLNTYLLGHLRILKTHGRAYLTTDEHDRVLDERLDAYCTFLTRALLSPARRQIWRYHRDGLRDLGVSLSRGRLCRAILRQLLQSALSPGPELRNLVRLIRPRDNDGPRWRHWWAPTGFEAVKSVEPLESLVMLPVDDRLASDARRVASAGEAVS